MTTPPVARVAFLYAALFYELGVSLPFFPIWLRSRDLDDAAIGIVLAVPLLVRIVANPLVAAHADRTGRLRGTVLACAAVVALTTALLGAAHGLAAIVVVVALLALAQGPLIALTDALTLRLLQDGPSPELVYGRLRLWGSLAFAGASLSTGALLGVLAPWSIIALLCVAAAAVIVAAAFVPEPGHAPPPAASDGAGSPAAAQLSKLAACIVGAGLIQASHAAVYAFATLHWQSQGHSGLALGSLWALGIVGEIAVFALAGRFVRGASGAALLLVAGGAAAVVRWLWMATDPGVPALVLLQLSHGLTFGATHLGSIFLLARMAPPAMRAQAQGWLAAVWALCMAGFTSLSGVLSESLGQGLYVPMAAAAALGLVLLLPALPLRRAAPRAA